MRVEIHSRQCGATQRLISSMFLFGFREHEGHITIRFHSDECYLRACEAVAAFWPAQQQVQLGLEV